MSAIVVAAIWSFIAMSQAGVGGDRASDEAISPLFNQRLVEMQAQFDGATVAPAQPDLQRVGDRQAFLFPSGLISACAASGCAASACAASGCAGSGCAASACGGSGCGGSVCGGSACGGSACVGSACAGSGCAGSACGGSGCVGSSCGGSGCVGSVCGGSACGGSACGLSGCIGSACAQSGCVGSACSQSGCVGSACGRCNGSLDGNGFAANGVYGSAPVASASCPFGGAAAGPAAAQNAGLAVEPGKGGTRVSWISTGAEVDRFRLLWRADAESGERLVAEGRAASGHVNAVEIAGQGATGTYVLELTDRTGWVTRAGTDGTTARSPGKAVPAGPQPVGRQAALPLPGL
ncbi:hypothetical protein [Methylobacterium nonmethylotrophicum]|uniref:hypothetical protein n=1 Tax=Methylobacterium nonmethylotrophicum TaxID=1141884 RepID=UPI00197C10D9|nr:hypothetical protein [Methylobacterium nonmethylotrophicum]